MATYCIGDQRDFTRPVKGDPYLVQGLVRYPNGTETVHTATVTNNVALISVPTLTQSKKHTIRWNTWRNFGDALPSESVEQPFYVEETACSDPFEEPRLVQWAKPSWKHTGWGPEYSNNITTLPHTPRAGDILLLWIWNKEANSTSTIGSGSDGWTRVWDFNAIFAVSDEIWWKRWGDGDTDVTIWENHNNSHLFMAWAAVVRGCVGTGSPIDAISATQSSTNFGPTVTAPSVTTTGSNRFILRNYFTCTTGETDVPGSIGKHIDATDGRLTRSGWVNINLLNGASPVSYTKSLQASAGATGTASVGVDGYPTYFKYTTTVALIDA